MFSSGAARSLVPWWRLTAQSLAAGFFLSSIQITLFFENHLSRTLHNTLILDPCRNGRNLRVREVRSSILRLALFVRPNGLVVLCFFLFFLPYSNTTAILVGSGASNAPARPWQDRQRLAPKFESDGSVIKKHRSGKPAPRRRGNGSLNTGQLGMSRQRSLSATTFAAKMKGTSPN